MATKRKKLPLSQQEQKHLAAQYRAEFFRKMKLVIDSTCGNDIFPLIPADVLSNVYLSRSAPFKIVAADHHIIPSKLLNDIKVILPRLIKSQLIKLSPGNLEISLNDFYTVVFTIIMVRAQLSANTSENAGKVVSALVKFADDPTTNNLANNHMYSILQSYTFGINDLRETLYWFKYEMIVPKTLPAQTENIIFVYTVTPEIINVTIDDISRPAARVGWTRAFDGPEWVSIKPSLLGFKSPFAEIPLKVYIQNHALNRLMERIDCFWPGVVQFNMFDCLLNPKYTYNSNNELLIEFTLFGTKAGYFRADIVDGVILLRTFLFVTNNGTPEGKRLEQNTGLQKLDKKYLSIDKLSTFMSTNLDKNEEVQRIFKSSGCQCILDLHRK